MALSDYFASEVEPAIHFDASSPKNAAIIATYGLEFVQEMLSISEAQIERVASWYVSQRESDATLGRSVLKPSDSPHVYVVGGQPGAGKSSAIDKIKAQEVNSGIVNVEMDAYRTDHPNIEKIKEAIFDKYKNYDGPDKAAKMSSDLTSFTQAWSDAVVARFTEKLFNKGYNIVMESTLRHPKSKIAFGELLKSENPNTKFSMTMVAVSSELAYKGSTDRGKQMQICLDFLVGIASKKGIDMYSVTRGAISRGYYDGVCADLPSAMETMCSPESAKIVDSVTMVTRAGDVVYDRDNPSISGGLSAKEIESAYLTGDRGLTQYVQALENQRDNEPTFYGVNAFMKENRELIQRAFGSDMDLETIKKLFVEQVKAKMDQQQQAIEALNNLRMMQKQQSISSSSLGM